MLIYESRQRHRRARISHASSPARRLTRRTAMERASTGSLHSHSRSAAQTAVEIERYFATVDPSTMQAVMLPGRARYSYRVEGSYSVYGAALAETAAFPLKRSSVL